MLSERSTDRAKRVLDEIRGDPERREALRSHLLSECEQGPKVRDYIYHAELDEVIPSDRDESWEGKRVYEFKGQDPDYRSVGFAARLLGVSERQVRKMILQGQLQAKKQGKEWAIDLNSLEEQLANRVRLRSLRCKAADG